MSHPERIRSDLPVARVTGEVLPLGEPPPHLPSPYVSHPGRLTFRGWVVGGIIWAVVAAVVLAICSMPDIAGWFR